jgi:transketolase
VRLVIGYTGLNVKVAASHAGITVGEDGASHQTTEDIALMRVIPGMTVLVPADATETRLMVKAAAARPGPVYLRLGREPVPVIFDDNYQVQVGKVVRLREGRDVAILACGIMTGYSLTAAQALAEQGVQATVLNVSTIKPLDAEAIVAAARECGCMVTAEEHSVIGGLGGAVAETLVERCPVPVEMVGVRDRFGQSGKPALLLEEYGLTPRHIQEAALRAIKRK